MDVPPIPLDILGAVPYGTDDGMEKVRQATAALERAFAHAGALYDRGDHGQAAEAFMNAARAARTHDLLAPHRTACYRNAAKAWARAGAIEEKRPLLDQAAREDPLCADEIHAILEILLGSR